MQDYIIKIQNLVKTFGTHAVLKGINLNIERGKSLVVVGGSGTGKSVLIKTIIGLMAPSSGSINVNGVDMTSANNTDKKTFLTKCGFLFQGGALFDSLTIEENITFFASRLYGLNNKSRRELALDKLNAVGLSQRVLDLYPSELSGGMQKRASLARTIATNPEIIFFDEPTTGLDPIMSNVINELIVAANKKLGCTSIIITHDMNSVRAIADKVAMLHDGSIMWEGTSTEMDKTNNPYVQQFVSGNTEGPIAVY